MFWGSLRALSEQAGPGFSGARLFLYLAQAARRDESLDDDFSADTWSSDVAKVWIWLGLSLQSPCPGLMRRMGWFCTW